MQLKPNSPARQLNLTNAPDDLRPILLQLLRLLEEMQTTNARVVNFNELTYVSQNAQPTPDEGKTMIWKDADATSGNPKAYIVTTQGGATYTFASEELVP
ncbi:MAG: hypothetical protein E6Q97_11920 [Desulfurellales bacterium]|nr:MAG: hypothetical protein E6Q97_11920 [Desulfurellales bacterium]